MFLAPSLPTSSAEHGSKRKVYQVGSHIVLETNSPLHQRIAIPDHRTLRIGTLNSILRAVAKHKGVSRDAIIVDL
jgi:hypothetical protein